MELFNEMQLLHEILSLSYIKTTRSMKITSFLCFVLISAGDLFAQEIDNRLYSTYSPQELETMIATNPDQYRLLDYALDNALYLANYDSAKGGNFETISIDIQSLPTFLDLNLKLTDQNQYFKVAGEDKLLVVKSTIVLNYEMAKK